MSTENVARATPSAGAAQGPAKTEGGLGPAEQETIRAETRRAESWRQSEASRIAGLEVPDEVVAQRARQPSATVSELLQGDVVPGPDGIRIDGPAPRVSELFDISIANQREVLLTMTRDRESGDRTFRIYGGRPGAVQMPEGLDERPIAHTHPNDWEGRQYPSKADMQALQKRYDELIEAGVSDPNARQMHLIIHGRNPGEVTPFWSGPGKDPDLGETGELQQERPERPRAVGPAGVALAVGGAGVEVGDRMRNGETAFEAVTGVATELAEGAYNAVVTEPNQAASATYEEQMAMIDRAVAAGELPPERAAELRSRAQAGYYADLAGGVATAVVGEDVAGLAGDRRYVEATTELASNVVEGALEGGAFLVGGGIDHGLAFVGAEETGAAIREGLADGASWLAEQVDWMAGGLGSAADEALGLGPETPAERAERQRRMEEVWAAQDVP